AASAAISTASANRKRGNHISLLRPRVEAPEASSRNLRKKNPVLLTYGSLLRTGPLAAVIRRPAASCSSDWPTTVRHEPLFQTFWPACNGTGAPLNRAFGRMTVPPSRASL